MNEDKFLNACKACGAVCCKMCGPDFTENEMKKVLETGYSNFFIKVNPNHYELQTKNGACPYLKEDDSCLIYEARPSMCKSWPVYPECKNGKIKYSLIECALTPLLSEQEVQALKKEAESIPKELLISSANKSNLPEREIDIGLERFNKFKQNLIK
ncbi:YkgJ family cysteine cluster protein [Candidatus Woesearchaeota archaeon]|nr:YkgJ family cysteine cluster protein [Candidatus Woesearchaeota archaeon]